jgi:acyl carrier protein
MARKRLRLVKKHVLRFLRSKQGVDLAGFSRDYVIQVVIARLNTSLLVPENAAADLYTTKSISDAFGMRSVDMTEFFLDLEDDFDATIDIRGVSLAHSAAEVIEVVYQELQKSGRKKQNE